MNKKNLVPAIIEEGVESAKNFLSKLITPAFEETGLLIRDQVTRWRFNNQVKMINKAKIYCEKNHINPKAVSLKLLVPLLDYSGIEEDEVMQDKWAILLSNLVDSEQNIENHVFPYILSQLSSGEFNALQVAFESKIERIQSIQKELDEFRIERQQKDLEIKQKIEQFERQMVDQKLQKYSLEHNKIEREVDKLKRELNTNTLHEASLLRKRNTPESLPSDVLESFEESNLIRLGLLKEVKEFYANSQTLKIPVDPNDRTEHSGYFNVDLDIDVDSDTDIVITELCELFISACKEKQGKK
jgi:hypothetical protein